MNLSKIITGVANVFTNPISAVSAVITTAAGAAAVTNGVAPTNWWEYLIVVAGAVGAACNYLVANQKKGD